MEKISIFDIYKIGVGPSSSHTLGPWKASLDFIESLHHLSYDSITIELFGSLSKTGRGHGTDIAIQLGLEGYDPKTIHTEEIGFYIQKIQSTKRITIGDRQLDFDPVKNITFHQYEDVAHPNTLTYHASYLGEEVLQKTYYSIGGGFIKYKGQHDIEDGSVTLPYPVQTGADLLKYTTETGLPISEIVSLNEQAFRPKKIITQKITEIYNTMFECVFKGCNTEGVLPGGLNVKRRAKALSKTLLGDKIYANSEDWIAAIRLNPKDFNNINKWISCFALAVNEENAALSRVVTSPTNGAAGVIPAVLFYYYFFCEFKGKEDLRKFFFTSGEIGCLFKKGATISAAVGGCQAEIGVSSAMAAAGLTELLGGSPSQVLMAAEIAMEHHLGLTCDPIGGLVQIPCIERNTMGAMKAITASNLALTSNPDDAIVNFDQVVKTMWDTAQDMNGKYKETSEGGLAYNVPVVFPAC
jgi:L-serine dehydratase